MFLKNAPATNNTDTLPVFTNVGENKTLYFNVPNVAVDSADTLGATLTQEAGGSRWSLTSGFADSDAKLMSLYFGYAGTLAVSDFTPGKGNVIELKKITTKGGNPGIDFVTSGSGTFGTGESASWLFASTNINDFQNLGLHISAIYSGAADGNGSAKYSLGSLARPVSPVPEPST